MKQETILHARMKEKDRLLKMNTCSIPTLLTIKQVAEILQVSQRTVLRMHKDGLLHGVRFSRKLIRFRAQELERVIRTLSV